MEEKLDQQLLILYASQTGNAMDAAERLGREAERRGCPSVSVLSIDESEPSNLPIKRTVIFVVSTTGQGDHPDSMKFVAKKLDKRLQDLGATPIIEKGLGDDQHPSGYEGALDPWMSALWTVLHQKNPELLPKGPDFVTPDATLIDEPRIQIIFHDAEEGVPPLSTTDLKCLEMQIERARSMSPAKFSGKNRPDCFLQMTKNQLLSYVDSGKDVRHFEFEAVSTLIDYEVGDVLEVLPGQNPAAVDAFIRRCNLNPESYITGFDDVERAFLVYSSFKLTIVYFVDSVLSSWVDPDDQWLRVHTRHKENIISENTSLFPVKLKSFAELTMDVASASPRRYFFEVMSFFAHTEHEKERLQYFASPEGRDDLYQYNQKERRTVLEVLEDFPSVQMPFEWLVQLVPPLQARAFSIASSHSVHPNQVHLTVNVVSWTTPYKRKRSGLCSSWLASIDPQQRVLIPSWFKKGSLPPPPPSLPLILIGPGTGCAPFHGFVEERALQSKSVPTAPIIFFFGCRNEKNDFLYRDFWFSHAKDGGVLSEEKGGGFYVAFSRDQPQKMYVQHKMREQSTKVWNMLTQGADIYVAGSSNKMPSDVLSAFEEIVSAESGVSKEASIRWIRALEKAGKYHVEAWS